MTCQISGFQSPWPPCKSVPGLASLRGVRARPEPKQLQLLQARLGKLAQSSHAPHRGKRRQPRQLLVTGAQQANGAHATPLQQILQWLVANGELNQALKPAAGGGPSESPMSAFSSHGSPFLTQACRALAVRTARLPCTRLMLRSMASWRSRWALTSFPRPRRALLSLAGCLPCLRAACS